MNYERRENIVERIKREESGRKKKRIEDILKILQISEDYMTEESGYPRIIKAEVHLIY